MKLFSALALLLTCQSLSAQFSWSTLVEPVMAYNADTWEARYDNNGHYYLMEKDNPNSPFDSRSLIYSDDGLHWKLTDYQLGRRHFIGLNGIVYAYEDGVLSHSTDHGVTYQPLASGIPFLRKFAVRETGQMIIANTNGIFSSTDQGQNWEKIGSPSGATPLPVAGNEGLGCWGFANNLFHYWHSKGPGEPFKTAYSGLYGGTTYQYTLTAVDTGGIIYISIGGDYNPVIHSEDGGETWTTSAVKPNESAQITSLSVLPDGRPLARLEDGKWYVSDDHGVTWTETTTTVPSSATHVFSHPDGSFFVYGTPLLQRYQSPGQFTFAAFGLDNSSNISLHVADTVYMSVKGGILRLENNNTTFIPVITSPETEYCTRYLWDNEGRYYKHVCDDVLLASGDLGAHFDTLFLETVPGASSYIQQIIRSGDIIRVLTDNMLFTSIDGGVNWTHSAPVSGLGIFYGFQKMAISASGIIYIIGLDNILRSLDDGQTFQVLPFFSWVSHDIQCVGDTVYVLKDGGYIFSSTDGGANWSALPVNPLDGIFDEYATYMEDLIVTNDQQIYAAGRYDGKGAIYQTKDLGQTWTFYEIPNKIDGAACNLLGIGKDERLYFTSQRWVLAPSALYKTDHSAFVANHELQSPVNRLKVFPNPAAAQLYVSGLTGGAVQIGLYNQAGMLLQQYQSVETEITLDVAALPAGIYILKVTGGDGVQWSKWIKAAGR